MLTRGSSRRRSCAGIAPCTWGVVVVAVDVAVHVHVHVAGPRAVHVQHEMGGGE